METPTPKEEPSNDGVESLPATTYQVSQAQAGSNPQVPKILVNGKPIESTQATSQESHRTVTKLGSTSRSLPYRGKPTQKAGGSSSSHQQNTANRQHGLSFIEVDARAANKQKVKSQVEVIASDVKLSQIRGVTHVENSIIIKSRVHDCEKIFGSCVLRSTLFTCGTLDECKVETSYLNNCTLAPGTAVYGCTFQNEYLDGYYYKGDKLKT